MKILTLLFFYFLSINSTLAQTVQSQLLTDSKTLINSERYGEAIELLNRYLAANPQSAQGFNLRGICHEKRGNYEQAVHDFRTAIKISPDDREISDNLKRAENDWHRILYNQIEGYKREIAINPSKPENYLEIGKCYKNLDEWNEAEIWYDIYLEKEEASADEMLRYIEILARNNHIKKGEFYLKKYVEKFPEDHRLWSKYGYFLYWLSKTRAAENAFNRALQIRPYFKEALDGLNLVKGNGALYSVNDTYDKSVSGKTDKVYVIDKLLKSLNKNPENSELRFKLVEEFLKYNRIEEAYQQLDFLKEKFYNEKRFNELYEGVIAKRNNLIDQQIDDLKSELLKNPSDKNSVMKLAEMLVYRKKIDEAINFLDNYLQLNDDDEVRFLLAKYHLWNSDLCKSKMQLEILLNKNYQNPEAHLMLAKVYLWLDTELLKAEFLFEKYLSEFPDDKEAISGLIETLLKLEQFSDAEKILLEKKQVFSSNEIENWNSKIKDLKQLKKLSEELQIIERARDYASNKNYSAAIKKYLDYLSFQPENIQAKLELADVYAANSEFENSNKIYEEILLRNYDLEIDKRRAKNILWSKNYKLAVQKFKRLLFKDSDDIETKLLLADSYLFNGDKDNARKIYNELLQKSPDSYILNKRLIWLGDKSSYSGFNYSFQLIPSANYFNDNQNFTYSGQSFLIKTALTDNFAIGGAIHRGGLSSLNEERSLYLVKGILNLRINEIINTEASFGQLFFINSENLFFGDFSFSVAYPDKFLVNGFFRRTDASLELNSPELVDNRLHLNNSGLNLSFYPGLNFILSSSYHLILPEDKNQGHKFIFRAGNEILTNFSFGYELYYYTFKNNSALYWSPKDFLSHSAWLEWKIFNSSNVFLNVGGKVGIIPENNFIISEAFSDFNYYFTENLLFKLYISGGKTYRKETGGYGSFSAISSLVFSF